MMMQSTVMAAAMLGLGSASFLKTCFDTTEGYGFIDGMDHLEIQRRGEFQGDQAKLMELPAQFMAWARPHSVTVCSDDEYIHGIQFALSMHDADVEDFQEAINGTEMEKKFVKVDDVFNEMTSTATNQVVTMDMIGSRVGDCQTLVIDKQDRIGKILANSDGSHIRHLEINLQSGNQVDFGDFECNDTAETPCYKKRHVWSFTDEHKIDILGAFGYVAPDTVTPAQDHIVSLGFYVNTCPIRGLLDMEKQFLATVIPQAEEEAADSFLIFVCIALLSTCAIAVVYLCLKNRGILCKKNKNDAQAVNQESVELSMQAKNNDNISDRRDEVPGARD